MGKDTIWEAWEYLSESYNLIKRTVVLGHSKNALLMVELLVKH
jgi:hypothetical protein